MIGGEEGGFSGASEVLHRSCVHVCRYKTSRVPHGGKGRVSETILIINAAPQQRKLPGIALQTHTRQSSRRTTGVSPLPSPPRNTARTTDPPTRHRTEQTPSTPTRLAPLRSSQLMPPSNALPTPKRVPPIPSILPPAPPPPSPRPPPLPREIKLRNLIPRRIMHHGTASPAALRVPRRRKDGRDHVGRLVLLPLLGFVAVLRRSERAYGTGGCRMRVVVPGEGRGGRGGGQQHRHRGEGRRGSVLDVAGPVPRGGAAGTTARRCDEVVVVGVACAVEVEVPVPVVPRTLGVQFVAGDALLGAEEGVALGVVVVRGGGGGGG